MKVAAHNLQEVGPNLAGGGLAEAVRVEAAQQRHAIQLADANTGFLRPHQPVGDLGPVQRLVEGADPAGGRAAQQQIAGKLALLRPAAQGRGIAVRRQGLPVAEGQYQPGDAV